MKLLTGPACSSSMRISCTTGVLLLGLLAGEANGTVQTTGSMSVARYGHTSTFVGTGRVLVAGGYGTSGRLATAELFDPSTGLFSPTGSMPVARNGHTATVLANGKVLVVGGNGDSGTLATCTLYDPRTGAWTSTGSLGTPRREHTATLLANGKVLVAGGQNVLAPLSSAELYDPATGTWSATGSLAGVRFSHSAALLSDGRVLVAGGQTQVIPSSLYTASATLYDPATSTWSATNSMATARRSFTLTVLPTGLVVAAGGSNGSAVSGAERYIISNGTWGGAGDLGAGRSGHAAVLLPDARILVVGGSGTGGALASMAEYDPVGNSWSVVETGTARYSHAATLLPGGRVVVVGGLADGATPLANAELVDRMNPEWTNVGTTWGRRRGTATLLPNGKVLVLGSASVGDATRGALFNPGSNTWAYTAGAMVEPRWKHRATLLADGRVLIVGGSRNDGTNDDVGAEIYDPVTDSFAGIPDSPIVFFLEPVLLPDGLVLATADRCLEDPVWGVACSGGPWLWSPAGGTWSTPAGFPSTQAYGFTTGLTLLPNGKVLVLKKSNGPPYIATGGLAFVYSPYEGRYQFTGRPEGGGAAPYGTGILLPGGDVLFVTDSLEFVLYDVETGDFSWPFPRVAIPDWGSGASATALPDGRVLLVGGANQSKTAAVPYVAVFDPTTGVTAALPSLSTPRVSPATVVLSNGRVLVSGGSDLEGTAVTSAETLDLWPDVVESWRPFISTWPSSLAMDGAFTLTGTGFRGGAEASGGNGGLNSSADAPSVLLRRTEGGLSRWVPSSSAASWSSTSFPSATVSGLPGGTYRATLFASGRPSISRAVPVTACELSFGVLDSSFLKSVCQGELIELESRSSGLADWILWTLPDGSTVRNPRLAIPDAQPDDEGFYTVVATKDGCTSPPDTVYVRVAPVAQAPVVSAPSEMGVNESTRVSVAFHAGSTYEWTLSSGTILAGQGTNELYISAPSTGTSMTVTVVETVGETCVQPTAQETITLVPCSAPTPTASNTGPYCAGATISLSTPAVAGATYSWTGPGGFTSSLQNPVLRNAWEGDSGTYSVNVMVAGCTSAPATTDVVVYPSSAAPVITAPASVAPGEHFTASVPVVAGASWSWSVTKGTFLAGQGTRQVTVLAGATGPVTLTVTETYSGTGCGGPRQASVAIPVALPATSYHTVTPCRLFDTRLSDGPAQGAPILAPGETRTFTVGTRCGLTVATIRSLSVNQTVVTPSADGDLVAFRGDLTAVPTTSNVSFRAGRTRANNGILELSRAADGTFKVTNRSAGPVDFILDVNGVFR